MDKQSQQSNVNLRIWTASDAQFVVKVRNTPFLQQWFKQDHDLTLAEQVSFMMNIAPAIGYYGFIVQVGVIPIGITALKVDNNSYDAEFSIAVLPEYQKKGYSLQAMNRLISVAFNEFRLKRLYGDVFVQNPALSFFLHKCGFRAFRAKENAYPQKGCIDTVWIDQLKY